MLLVGEFGHPEVVIGLPDVDDSVDEELRLRVLPDMATGPPDVNDSEFKDALLELKPVEIVTGLLDVDDPGLEELAPSLELDPDELNTGLPDVEDGVVDDELLGNHDDPTRLLVLDAGDKEAREPPPLPLAEKVAGKLIPELLVVGELDAGLPCVDEVPA